MRNYKRSTFVPLIGCVIIVSACQGADDTNVHSEIPPWTTQDFYDAIDEDDAKQVQLYLSDSTRATKEYLGYYLLDYALEQERNDIAMMMVEAGAGVNTLPAVTHDNLEIVEAMLKNGVKPRGAWLAAERGNIAMLRLLLEHGEKDLSTKTAARNGELDAVKLLIEHGAQPEGLHDAVVKDHEDVVKLLLDSGADPNELDRYPFGRENLGVPYKFIDEFLSPLHYAVIVQSRAMVKLLLENGADPNVAPREITLLQVPSDFERWPSVLETATGSEGGDDEILALLKLHGASSTAVHDDEDIEREKELYKAASVKRHTRVLELLEEGVKPTVFGEFYYAFSEERYQPKLVQAFVEAGADPDDYRFGYPYGPASMALNNGDVENFKRLIEAGAQTDTFSTRYVYRKIACVKGLNEAIVYLWDLDFEEIGSEIWIAVNYGHTHMVEFLLARGSRPDNLKTAVEDEHVEIVKMLLAAGADPDQTDGSDEKTLHQLAADTGNQDIIDMLKKASAD
ncbi:MAG: hypothetical protein F4Z01_06305 [Gammaproteobacteria bacterium]|nr:hypothetical protein [Gammaproteobacteria bacterium]MYF37608.1 hypothetical protein [Gammaproteobacteria bacterium]